MMPLVLSAGDRMKIPYWRIVNVAIPSFALLLLTYLSMKSCFIPEYCTLHAYRTIQVMQFTIQVILSVWLLISSWFLLKSEKLNPRKEEPVILVLCIFLALVILLGESFPRYPQARERFRIAECRDNLQRNWLYLSGYLETHHSFPNEYIPLGNCPSSIGGNSYIYQGKGDGGVFPLLMDHSDNHPEVVNTLLSNGEVCSLRVIAGK